MATITIFPSQAKKCLSEFLPVIQGQLQPSLERKTILIIEDEYPIRQMMQDVLELEGYTVVTAADGSEGFEQLKALSSPPCAILLDLMMPGTSGWRFLDFLRADFSTTSIPIIICSAYLESAKSIRASAVIEKPVKLEKLLSTVNSFCG